MWTNLEKHLANVHGVFWETYFDSDLLQENRELIFAEQTFLFFLNSTWTKSWVTAWYPIIYKTITGRL